MKIKLLILSFFICLNSFGQKLPITGLCLSDVLAVTGGTCLANAFTNANPAYFDATYAIAGADWLSEFRNYGPPASQPIYYLGSQSEVAIVANPATSTFTVAADATFLVVCIKAVQYPYRNSGVPTWNGEQLTQAGSYNGSMASEIWYKLNPSTGSHTLSIANNTTLHIVSAWYKSASTISLYSTGSATGTGTNISATTNIQINTDLMIMDAVTYLYNGSSSILSQVSSTDTGLYFGITGAVFGSSTQYKIYKPTSGSTYSMGGVIGQSMSWQSVVACFKSN